MPDSVQEKAAVRSGRSGEQSVGRAQWLKAYCTVERLLSFSTVIAVVLVWYGITAYGLVSDVLMPAPQKVWHCFLTIASEGYKDSSLLTHLMDSMARLLGSFALVVVTAIPLGLASGTSAKVRAVFDPLVEFYRPLPPLAYYTLLVLWMGIENPSKVALLFLAGFAPVYLSCVAGVSNIRHDLINGAYTLGASRRQVFFHVILPASLPDIFTGLKTSLGFTYTTLVAAEMVAAVSGIGWMVLDASKFLRSDVIFVGIIIMGITGILLDRVLRVLEEKIVPWRGKE
jgi:taurine transport system permease protein